MSAKIPSFTLNTGASIPAIGMGCWRGQPGLGQDDELAESLTYAIQKAGYRHLDTAAMYQVRYYTRVYTFLIHFDRTKKKLEMSFRTVV